MSIDFEKVSYVRDNLLNALLGWQKKNDDMLWRSRPNMRGTAPSFTCTAISIQALHEAGKVGQARMFAAPIQSTMFQENEYRPLPSESNNNFKHIMNNSWTVFSLLECFPEQATTFWPAVKWIMDAQDTNGWWNLLPEHLNDETSCPIFCAYALAAIIQYYNKADEMRGLDGTQRYSITQCLHKGIGALLNAKIDIQGQDILLWPQKKEGRGPASFGVSTMCAHVLYKAGKILNDGHLLDRISRTFEEFGHGLEKTSDDVKITVMNHPVTIWDTIQDSNLLNYHHSTFAPISLVTVLRYINNNNANRLYTLINHFTNWILTHALNDGNAGVWSSPSMPNATTWSTAAAIITLSRILSHKDLIESNLDTPNKNGQNPKKLSIATKIARMFNKFTDNKTVKGIATLASIGGFIGFVIGDSNFKVLYIAISGLIIVLYGVVYLIRWLKSMRR